METESTRTSSTSASGEGRLAALARFIARHRWPVIAGYEIKPLAIGLAAGIIFDATVIRALLVPALMKLLGDANWWLPHWTRRVLFIRDERVPEPALEG